MTAIDQNEAAMQFDFDPRVFRDTLGLFASGITVVAGHDGTDPIGFTCQSFQSVSLDPPLISFTVMRTSTTFPLIRETGKFSVNVLTGGQHDISSQFARSGTDKWAGVQWSETQQGNPVIRDTLIWVDCVLFDEHIAGDHNIVVGRVVEMCPPESRQADPLIYFGSKYRRLVAAD